MTELISNVKRKSDRRSGMVHSFGIPANGGIVSRAVTAAAANIKRTSQQIPSGRASKHYSVSLFYSMATEQDSEIEDELARVQKSLRELKADISAQSKNNFLLEKDVRFLDSRIALLIQNRMAVDDQNDISSQLDDHDERNMEHHLDDRKLQHYSHLFFLLQNEPGYIASLCRLVNLSEIDTLLQTVMFTLYGNQYESREENLLLTMFQNVLAAQFESTVEFGSLLRANTPVSRMLMTYTRRGPGQSYLKSVLSEKINELIEKKDMNFQINPLKVYDEIITEKLSKEGTLPPNLSKSVTPEIAAANPEVQAIIEPRLTKLIEVANEFLTTIIRSLNNIPYGIRWICKQIRSLTKRKYPQATETAISSLIGGFFFLRFVNPAIVTPQAYMLIDSYPSSNPRTTLTLIAKLLQNLANKPTYAKEAYMIPTNRFVEENKQRIQKFLNDICEVSDFYESLEMDQYMALSRKDIFISITPNEMYSTQALLSQHIQKIAPEPMHRLRILLQDLGPVPPQIPRQANRPVQLPLYSRWERGPVMGLQQQQQDTALILTTPENNITQNDLLYMETKSIFVQILRSMPHILKMCTTSSSHLDLIRVSEAAGTAKDALLVSKGIKVQSMLQELEEAGVVSRKNHYELLVQEIKQELIHLGDLKERVKVEVESLQQVFRTIQDHNNYLQSQLETYKAYLQNVRMQSAGGSGGKGGGSTSKVVPGFSTTKAPSSEIATFEQSQNYQPHHHAQQQSQQQQQQHHDHHHMQGGLDMDIANGGGAGMGSNLNTPSINGKNINSNYHSKKKSNNGPFKFSHQQLEKDGIILDSEVPNHRRANIYLMIQSPIMGTFIISLHYKGREKPILEIDLKLDDLLEKQKEHVKSLDLEYVKLNVAKTIQLINKSFKVKSK
ncbi:Rho GTPase activation protein [Mycotypha africana]|uniref:Rho GTPase activation protein n=1 Tax=Mycotypha africana TaxID=64632 RepID=UPI002300B9E7|nr:Rho GTPase activation protein [Mycotypha africana]KAI8977274.1 Rho GTPase activation protein [Mycotypha africana]